MVTLKIETKTDDYESAVILIKEALRQISTGSQAGVIGGGIGECMFDVDLSAAQHSVQLTGCTCGAKNNIHVRGCALWRDLGVHASN